jgi:hypothetical protein
VPSSDTIEKAEGAGERATTTFYPTKSFSCARFARAARQRPPSWRSLPPFPSPPDAPLPLPQFIDAIDEINEYAKTNYGDEWDAEKHAKMQHVSMENTIIFFGDTMMKPFQHDIPMVSYPVCRDLAHTKDFYDLATSGPKVIHSIDFELDPAYSQIFNRMPIPPVRNFLMHHNQCMVTPAFVDQLVPDVKQRVKEFGGK